MRQAPIGEHLYFYVVELQTAKPPGSSELLIPCGDRGQTPYKSQRSSRAQQECSEPEAITIGSNEGSFDPSSYCEEHC